MIRKYMIRLTPRLALSLYLPAKLPIGSEGLLLFLSYLQPRLWKLFLLLLFPAFFIIHGSDPGSSHLLWMYGFVVTLLFLQIVLRLLGKADYLPTVSYDLLLLTYTSVIAVSLLLSIVSQRDSFPLWGGSSYRIISGLSLIAYWFVYYLTNVFGRQEGMLRRSIEMIAYSGLVAVVWTAFLSLIDSSLMLGYGIADAMVVLLPFWSWMFLSAPRRRLIYGFNMLVAVIVLLQSASVAIIIALMASSLVLLAILAATQRGTFRKQLASIGKDFDDYSDQKISLGRILNRNSKLIMTGWLLLIAVAGVVWLLANRLLLNFDLLERGVQGLQKIEGVLQILFGTGLSGNGGTIITELVRSYGLLSFLVFAILLLIIMRDIVRVMITSKNDFVFALAGGVAAFIAGSVAYFTVSWTSELHLIVFWVFAGLAGVMRSLFIADEKLELKPVLNDFDRIRPESTQRVFRIIRLLLALFLILGILYFSNLLFTIQVFITG